MIKWLEVIKLRSTGENPGRLEELIRSMAQIRQPGLVEIKTYRRAALETDWSVHLHWKSERPERDGSIPGLRLAQAFKDFGLIDHSLWIEEEK